MTHKKDKTGQTTGWKFVSESGSERKLQNPPDAKALK